MQMEFPARSKFLPPDPSFPLPLRFLRLPLPLRFPPLPADTDADASSFPSRHRRRRFLPSLSFLPSSPYPYTSPSPVFSSSSGRRRRFLPSSSPSLPLPLWFPPLPPADVSSLPSSSSLPLPLRFPPLPPADASSLPSSPSLSLRRSIHSDRLAVQRKRGFSSTVDSLPEKLPPTFSSSSALALDTDLPTDDTDLRISSW